MTIYRTPNGVASWRPHTLFVLIIATVFAWGCSPGGEHEGEKPEDIEPIGQTDSESDQGSKLEDLYGWDEAIPHTCDEIEENKDNPDFGSTIGCEFYPVVLENGDPWITECAIVVGNVQLDRPVSVTLYDGKDGDWHEVRTREIQPMRSYKFKMMCNTEDDIPGSGFITKGSYKVVSDAPIAAYQLNPRNGASSYSSDASLLLPSTNLDTRYEIVGWDTTHYWHEARKEWFYMRSYFVVVATEDGTSVTVTPSVAPRDRGVVPGTGEPFTIEMNQGDVFYVWGEGDNDNLSGSVVQSNEDHPVAVYTGSTSSFISGGDKYADHLEEQMVAPKYWGTEFVASRVPVRRPDLNPSEPVLWQIYVRDNDTRVIIKAAEGITGLPFESEVLNAGDLVQFYVEGTAEEPGDFYVVTEDSSATEEKEAEPKPVVLMQYMTSAQMIAPELNGSSEEPRDGDPAMVYMGPTQQFLSRYVVYVPDTWENDALIITRKAGSAVLLDGEPVDDSQFAPVFGTSYEVARIIVADDMHTVISDDAGNGLAVIVTGWDSHDSYAYAGGMGMAPITTIVD